MSRLTPLLVCVSGVATALHGRFRCARQPKTCFEMFCRGGRFVGTTGGSTTRAATGHQQCLTMSYTRSRLEQARLLMADFDTSVNHIVAQPFILQTPIGGKIRRHIPDYLLLTDGGPVVVDVKPAEPLDDPAVAETFEWARSAMLQFSRLMLEKFAGTPYAKHWEGTP